MIRAVLLALTIAALLCMWGDRPKPAKIVQVDYCPISYRAAVKDELGVWHFGWGAGYGPCALMDRFEEI